MTTVIVLQLLLAALAGLLLLEAFLYGREERVTAASESDDHIEFHPELLAQWDDEAEYGGHRRCTRPRTHAAQPLPHAGSRNVATRTHIH